MGQLLSNTLQKEVGCFLQEESNSALGRTGLPHSLCHPGGSGPSRGIHALVCSDRGWDHLTDALGASPRAEGLWHLRQLTSLFGLDW